MGSTDILQTVENRLTSLCKILAERVKRTIMNDKYPIADIFQLMARCFTLQELLHTRAENYRVDDLTKLSNKHAVLKK